MFKSENTVAPAGTFLWNARARLSFTSRGTYTYIYIN